MGGKNGAKRKGKKSGNPQKREQQGGSAARNDFRGAGFKNSQVLGHGTMAVETYVQQYAPVPTALDALPQPPTGFTGRTDDLAFIAGVLDPERSDSGPAVAVLSGWGGVGKTTLAYAAGHAAQERDWFTGFLLVDLHGYDPHPAQAEEALEALLRSLGVRSEHLPPPGAGREALYRSQLNERQKVGERLLVVADNASTVAQVRPLLPPGHHGMLVTSRHSLTGLGRLRTVNRLQPEDAVALLDAALKNNDPDDRRVEEEPEAAEQVALACGYLPLALQITAALLAQDPGQPLAERANALGEAEGILDGLNDGERSLRGMFEQSLERLTPQEQDLFRLLSLNPGPDISTPAAAVLANQPQPATEHLLGRLAASHLIERNPAIRGRWQMHDLLRAYAHEQAQAAMARGRAPRRRYEQAHDRLVRHYVQHAQAANTHINFLSKAFSSQFSDRDQALTWCDTERENLIAIAHISPQASIHFSFVLGSYLDWRRRHQDLLVIRSLALDACQAIEETKNEAAAWDNLGLTLRNLRRFDEALHAHQTARDQYQQTGNTYGEPQAWNNLGLVFNELRRFDEALHAHQTARDQHQQTGNTYGEAQAWNNLGLVFNELRRFDEALHAHQTARDLFQQTGNIHSEANAWNNLGLTYRALGRFDESLYAHKIDLDYCQRMKDTHGEATTWSNLGLVLQELRRFDEALHAHQKSCEKFQQTSDIHREAAAWTNLGLVLQKLQRFDEALHAHQTARDLFQQTSDTIHEAAACNNLGTTYRALGNFEEGISVAQRALEMLTEKQDWFRIGEVWGELAVTQTAAGADPSQIRNAWNESAAAYTQAGADEEATASRTCADKTEIPGI